jgi:hypothetical protein
MNTYEDLVRSQPKISNQDFQVRIAENVLLPEHIDTIYSIINSTSESQTRVQPWAGHKVWDVKFTKEIEDRITAVAQSIVGNDVSLDYDYSFARYSRKFGYECKLFPHYDNRDSQRITFDIQLRASEPWSVVVENTVYPLKNNQALIFAGTQQIHWREKKKISDDAEIDMIFCHLTYNIDKPLDNDQKNILNERAHMLMNQTGISNLPEPLKEI